MEEHIFNVRQMDTSCWRIEEKGTFTLGVNCYLVTGLESAVLIDCGCGQESIRGAAERLTSLPLKLVCTHGDWDHTFGYKQFDAAYLHPAEFDRYHFTLGEKAPVAPLWDGDIIDLGGRRLEVILFPGHTPGSIVLLDIDNRVVFSGDSIEENIIIMDNTDSTGKYVGRNLAAYLASLQRIQKHRDRFDKIYSAHDKTVVASGVIDNLIALSEMVLRGELEGTAPPPNLSERNAKVYTLGNSAMLY